LNDTDSGKSKHSEIEFYAGQTLAMKIHNVNIIMMKMMMMMMIIIIIIIIIIINARKQRYNWTKNTGMNMSQKR